MRPPGGFLVEDHAAGPRESSSRPDCLLWTGTTRPVRVWTGGRRGPGPRGSAPTETEHEREGARAEEDRRAAERVRDEPPGASGVPVEVVADLVQPRDAHPGAAQAEKDEDGRDDEQDDSGRAARGRGADPGPAGEAGTDRTGTDRTAAGRCRAAVGSSSAGRYPSLAGDARRWPGALGESTGPPVERRSPAEGRAAGRCGQLPVLIQLSFQFSHRCQDGAEDRRRLRPRLRPARPCPRAGR